MKITWFVDSCKRATTSCPNTYGPTSRFAKGGHRHPSFYKGDLISPLIGMVCSASSAERCNHLTFSTKAWYAAFLLSKNSIIGRNFSSGPAVLQQKPGMQLFFFRKASSSARKSPGLARLCLIDIACSRLLVRTLDSLGSDRCSEPAHIGLELPTIRARTLLLEPSPFMRIDSHLGLFSMHR